MADMKEKLEVIAHIGDHITYKEDIGICYDSELAEVIEDAYMTLKNGVTVQDVTDINVGNKWISVKDRLPEKDVRVLVRLADDSRFYTKIDTDRIHYDTWVRWGTYVTHWMPLPSTEGLE